METPHKIGIWGFMNGIFSMTFYLLNKIEMQSLILSSIILILIFKNFISIPFCIQYFNVTPGPNEKSYFSVLSVVFLIIVLGSLFNKISIHMLIGTCIIGILCDIVTMHTNDYFNKLLRYYDESDSEIDMASINYGAECATAITVSFIVLMSIFC